MTWHAPEGTPPDVAVELESIVAVLEGIRAEQAAVRRRIDLAASRHQLLTVLHLTTVVQDITNRSRGDRLVA